MGYSLKKLTATDQAKDRSMKTYGQGLVLLMTVIYIFFWGNLELGLLALATAAYIVWDAAYSK
jgi:hypothetical protein